MNPPPIAAATLERPTDTATEHHRIAIIGTGFSGIGMAYRLKRAGIHDFVMLERASDLGGTWRDNSYPGCQCDIPSCLYSYSWAPNPDWTRANAPQSELWEYTDRVAQEHGIKPHIRCDHEVLAADWDDETKRWKIETASGSLTADILIAGPGGLSDPAIPNIPGRDSFEGTTFHSASWNHDHDLGGRKVAVIGTGSSAVQFIPEIQKHVGRLTVFQRTAGWIMPSPDRPIGPRERLLYNKLPWTLKLQRRGLFWFLESWMIALRHPRLMFIHGAIARLHLRSQVPDPALRKKVTPDFTIGCKRIVFSSKFFPALSKPNVELVTDGIEEIRPNGIVTADGTLHEVDTIIYGTGFKIQDLPLLSRIRGREGKTPRELFSSLEGHRGVAATGFPNFFTIMGPNTGGGNNSIIFMIEAQVQYVMDALHQIEANEIATLEVLPESQKAFNDDIQDQLEGTVWTAGGCISWYNDANGRNTTLWPGQATTFRRMLREIDLSEYKVTHREPAVEPRVPVGV